MSRGFEDAGGVYHRNKDCPNLIAQPTRILPITIALKQDVSICEECVDR